jgi:hypothetical protein
VGEGDGGGGGDGRRALRQSATGRRSLTGGGGALKAMHRATDDAACDHEKEHTTQQAGATAGEDGCRVGDVGHGARERRHAVQRVGGGVEEGDKWHIGHQNLIIRIRNVDAKQSFLMIFDYPILEIFDDCK